MSEYTVKLPIFEGPLDLLLHLIKVNEMEITEISISQITSQYLETVRLMETLDLDVAGDFLVMAASLINIKLRSILPDPEEEVEEGEQEDQGDDYLSARALMQRLIEYRKFKEAALSLGGMAERRALMFVREVALPTINQAQADSGVRGDVDLLLEAFSRVVKFVARRNYHEVQNEEYNIDDKMSLVRRRVLLEGRIDVDELLQQCQVKIEMIVTLIALLELTRLKELRISQVDCYGKIVAFARGEDETEAPTDTAREAAELERLEADILANRTGLIDNSAPPTDEDEALAEGELPETKALDLSSVTSAVESLDVDAIEQAALEDLRSLEPDELELAEARREAELKAQREAEELARIEAELKELEEAEARALSGEAASEENVATVTEESAEAAAEESAESADVGAEEESSDEPAAAGQQEEDGERAALAEEFEAIEAEGAEPEAAEVEAEPAEEELETEAAGPVEAEAGDEAEAIESEDAAWREDAAEAGEGSGASVAEVDEESAEDAGAAAEPEAAGELDLDAAGALEPELEATEEIDLSGLPLEEHPDSPESQMMDLIEAADRDAGAAAAGGHSDDDDGDAAAAPQMEPFAAEPEPETGIEAEIESAALAEDDEREVHEADENEPEAEALVEEPEQDASDEDFLEEDEDEEAPAEDEDRPAFRIHDHEADLELAREDALAAPPEDEFDPGDAFKPEFPDPFEDDEDEEDSESDDFEDEDASEPLWSAGEDDAREEADEEEDEGDEAFEDDEEFEAAGAEEFDAVQDDEVLGEGADEALIDEASADEADAALAEEDLIEEIEDAEAEEDDLIEESEAVETEEDKVADAGPVEAEEAQDAEAEVVEAVEPVSEEAPAVETEAAPEAEAEDDAVDVAEAEVALGGEPDEAPVETQEIEAMAEPIAEEVVAEPAAESLDEADAEALDEAVAVGDAVEAVAGEADAPSADEFADEAAAVIDQEEETASAGDEADSVAEAEEPSNVEAAESVNLDALLEAEAATTPADELVGLDETVADEPQGEVDEAPASEHAEQSEPRPEKARPAPGDELTDEEMADLHHAALLVETSAVEALMENACAASEPEDAPAADEFSFHEAGSDWDGTPHEEEASGAEVPVEKDAASEVDEAAEQTASEAEPEAPTPADDAEGPEALEKDEADAAEPLDEMADAAETEAAEVQAESQVLVDEACAETDDSVQAPGEAIEPEDAQDAPANVDAPASDSHFQALPLPARVWRRRGKKVRRISAGARSSKVRVSLGRASRAPQRGGGRPTQARRLRLRRPWTDPRAMAALLNLAAPLELTESAPDAPAMELCPPARVEDAAALTPAPGAIRPHAGRRNAMLLAMVLILGGVIAPAGWSLSRRALASLMQSLRRHDGILIRPAPTDPAAPAFKATARFQQTAWGRALTGSMLSPRKPAGDGPSSAASGSENK